MARTWSVGGISADSHPVAGGFVFSVGAPDAGAAVDIPVAEPTAALRVTRQVTEAAGYVGALGAVGVVLFQALLLPGSGSESAVGAGLARVRRRLRRIGYGLFALAVAALAAMVPVVTAWQDGAGIDALADGGTWRTGLTSDHALSALLVVAGLATTVTAAAVGTRAAARDRIRSALGAATFAGAALAIGALAVVGHTRTFGPAWLVVTADLLHAATAAVWFGGLIGLAVTLARSSAVPAGPAAVVVSGFSRLAAGLVLALVAAGAALAWRVLNSWSALLDTGYGLALSGKILLVVAILAVAGWNRFRLVPHVVRAPDETRAWRGLRRTVRIEAALVVGVVALTGVLVTQSPSGGGSTRPPPAPVPEAVATSAALGTATVAIRLTPGIVGVNSLELTVRDAAGNPVEPVEVPGLRVTLPAADIGPLDRPLARTGAGRYEAVADFPLAGDWTVDISVRLSRYDNPTARIGVTIR